MFNENNCLENLKHIVSQYADDENMKNLSLDELRSSFTKIADNMYCVSVSNCLKYKNMLWNIDNLKPEIRTRFKTELFNTWHSIYIKSAKVEPTEDRAKIKKQESTPAVKAEKIPEVDETEQQPTESEKQKRVASTEDADISLKEGPTIEQSPITSAHKFENDWFDKFLDFIAAIIGGLAGMVGR